MSDQFPLFENLPPLEDGARMTFKALERPLWTENKAKLIAAYLRYFVFITKHGAYIDGFTGPQNTDDHDGWAAKLVLETEPRWLRSFYLCERSAKKVRLIHKLRDSQPNVKGRTIDVYKGDFNVAIDTILTQPGLGPSVASFCLLDQHTFECDWSTVRKLALHKPSNKVEVFYFLGTGWLDRSFSGVKEKSKLDKWWGDSSWIALKGLKAHERSEVLCKKFSHELLYKYVYGWPIWSHVDGGRIMYYMIHASDHDQAPQLMRRAFKFATGMIPPGDQLELCLVS